MKKEKKIKNKTRRRIILWSILSTLGLVFVIGLPIGIAAIIKYGSAGINMALGTTNFITVEDTESEPEIFFESSYDYLKGNKKYERSSADKLLQEDNKSIYATELEGATLLWNKNNALPLSGNEYVNLLSHSSVDLVKGGSGSGYVITTAHHDTSLDISTNMKDAFTDKGFSVNQTLWDFYKSGAGSSYNRTSPATNCKQWQVWDVNEVPWSVYTNDVKNSFVNNTKDSIAIITISRTGGEYSDLHYNYNAANDFVGLNAGGSKENTPEDNGYLGLTDQEEELFQNVATYKNAGTFKKVVVLLNTGNPLRFKDLTTYYPSIDACMWIGQPGSYGINAVVDLLKGKDASNKDAIPSGHLVDTFMYDLNSAPASYNDGNYRYQGDLSKLYKPESNYYNTYSVYKEGIYIGYRYYETRYEDTVLGQGSATSPVGSIAGGSGNNWDYEKEVAFPFGYGDTYTTFAYSNFSVTEQDKSYEVKVTVTNTGNYEGKEAVQVYLQKPYTQYDKTNGLEKASIELCGYAKTNRLAPNESQEVTVDVAKEEFKTYDHNNKKTYILEAGDYYLTVAPGSHDALNNVIKAKNGSATIKEGKYQGYTRNNLPVTGTDFVHHIEIMEDDYVTYSVSTQTGEPITNQLDLGDLNKYEHSGGQTTTYVSRSNWGATFPTTHEVLYMNDDLAEDIRPDVAPDPTGYEMPSYSKFTSGGTTPNVAAGDVVAYQLMEAPLFPEKASEEEKAKTYDDGLSYVEHWNSLWNKALDQMTFEEQALMAANAYHQMFGASSINLPSSKQENGPVGITKRAESGMAIPDKNIQYYYYIAYPSAQVVAATMNDEIALDVGNHKSEDMLYLGYNGIYGPGINMHRNPYSGRAYEYPSEDPFLAGTIEYNESVGIESKGCLAYAKHFVMNDSETNRAHVGVWNNEQASREIYLKAFEICFKEGGAHATMNGFNRIGPKWNGACVEVQTNILRKEWGWTGINISDWRNPGQNSMSYVQGVMSGTNSFDGNDDETAYTPYKNNAAVCQALRNSTKYMIYNIVRTNAMNGVSLGSKVIAITPWWQAALYIINNVFIVLFAFSVFMLALSILTPIVNKGKAAPVKVVKEKVIKPKIPLKQRFMSMSVKSKILWGGGGIILIVGILLAIILPLTLSQTSRIPDWAKDNINERIDVTETKYLSYEEGRK